MTMPEPIEPTGSEELSWTQCMRLLERLPTLPASARPRTIEALVRNPSPGIRERALRLGASVLPEERMIAYLRDDDDAVLRNAGLEMLKLRGARSYQVALALLDDEDADVVLQAVLILDHLRDPRALEALRGMLKHPDPNVVQAAILATGKLGNALSVSDLLPFLEGDPWLQMAVVQALGDLHAPRAVRPLSHLLSDLVAGDMVAEAIARIGGAEAYRTLAAHWLCNGDRLDAESSLGLLAHVLEGLARPPSPRAEVPGLRESIAARLGDPSVKVRTAAARCLLAHGPGPWDETCLATLEGADPDGGNLPPALRRRTDLIGGLLRRPGALRAWGFLLGALAPREIPPAEFAAALADAASDPDLLRACLRPLSRLRHPELAGPLLELYLALPGEARSVLEPALRPHRESLRGALAEHGPMRTADRLVLSALLGEPPAKVADAIVALHAAERPGVISVLAANRAIVRRLPWQAWLAEAPEIYGVLAAEVACRAGLDQLLPTLRRLPVRLASPALLRAFAELRDAESVPLLLELVEVRPDLRLLAFESLGRIGGPEARATLAAATAGNVPAEVRIAYRALSVCASESDEEIFRKAVGHPDWYVRLACAEVLGRSPQPENLAALARLAGDPVPAVAHRALSFLEG